MQRKDEKMHARSLSFFNRPCRNILFLWVFFFWGANLSMAEDVEIGKNIKNAEHHVIRLTAPFESRDEEVGVKFQTEKKDGSPLVVTRRFQVREGRHAYDMRDIEVWKGFVPLVMLDVEENSKISGEVAPISLGDELDIFFKPERVKPYTPNGLERKSLFGVSWNVWISLVFTAAAISLYFFYKRSLALVLFLAFWISWSFVDLRAIYDHVGIIQATRRNGYWISKDFLSVQSWLKKYSNIIGDKSWTLDRSWEEEFPIFLSVIMYELAEKRFIPYEDKAKADLLFSVKNGKFKIFYLKP